LLKQIPADAVRWVSSQILALISRATWVA
jgi:hypothetical protein